MEPVRKLGFRVTGGLYYLTPEQIHAELKKNKNGSSEDVGMIVLTVLQPDPGWKKIGNLSKL
jgi:hypothetical protein